MRTLWQRPEPSAGPPSNPAELADRALHRRAIEAVIWGLPAVNFDLMLRQVIKLGGAPNQVVFWSRPITWKNQTLTPNPDTIYVMPFLNTADVGPVVLEIPPADTGTIVGSVDDCWQTAIADVGPAGADKGDGGKYLVLPPDHSGDVPDGYLPLRSPTYQSFALLRSNYRSADDADIADAVAYGKRVRVYPLSAAADPPQTTFIDAIDTLFDATIPYDARYFDSLNRIVQTEPWLDRDRAMIDSLKTIGIEKGKPFAPGGKARRILEARRPRGARVAGQPLEDVVLSACLFRRRTLARARLRRGRRGNDVELRRPRELPRRQPCRRPIPIAFFSAKHLGAGQFYLMTHQRQGGQLPRRRWHLSSARTRVRTGAAILVGDRLRRCDPRPDPQHTVVQSVIHIARSRNKRRRFGRHLFRPCGARRLFVELGSDQGLQHF